MLGTLGARCQTSCRLLSMNHRNIVGRIISRLILLSRCHVKICFGHVFYEIVVLGVSCAVHMGYEQYVYAYCVNLSGGCNVVGGLLCSWCSIVWHV